MATLTRYTGKPVRGTRGGVVIASASGDDKLFGLYIPAPLCDEDLPIIAKAILAWAHRHPATRHATGWLRLGREHFAYLTGTGAHVIYTRSPEAHA